MDLLDLPTELLVLVLSNLGLRDMLRASQTCRTLHVTIQESLLLQYLIELYAACLIPLSDAASHGAHTTPLTTEERAHLVRGLQTRWRSLDFRRTDQIRFDEGCPLYEIYGNVFAQFWLYDRATSDESIGGIEYCAGMNAYQLPSSLRGDDKAVTKWSFTDLGIRHGLLEVDIDPDQDLLVLLEGSRFTPNQPRKLSLHLRTLSANTGHPSTTYPLIDFTPSFHHPAIRSRVSVQIVGTLLAVLFKVAEDTRSLGEFVVWRWTSGEIVTRIRQPGLGLTFTFLTENVFVIPVVNRSLTGLKIELPLYRIPLQKLSRPSPSASSADTPSSALSISPCITYQLPLMRNDRVLEWNIICRSHPRPASKGIALPLDGCSTTPGSIDDELPGDSGSAAHLERELLPTNVEPFESLDKTATVETSSNNTHPPPFRTDPTTRLITFSFIHTVPSRHPDLNLLPWGNLHQGSYVLCTHVSTLLHHLGQLPSQEAIETPLPPSPPASPSRELEPDIDCLAPLPEESGGSSAHEMNEHAVSEGAVQTSRTPQQLLIPWEAWSVGKTRFIQDYPRGNWYTHTFGHRFVQPSPRNLDNPFWGYYIRVLDFNPYQVAKEALQVEKLSSTNRSPLRLITPNPLSHSAMTRFVHEPTTIPAFIFEEPVTTSLPYMESTLPRVFSDQFAGLMIDEEHVLNLEDAPPGQTWTRMAVYTI